MEEIVCQSKDLLLQYGVSMSNTIAPALRISEKSESTTQEEGYQKAQALTPVK